MNDHMDLGASLVLAVHAGPESMTPKMVPEMADFKWMATTSVMY